MSVWTNHMINQMFCCPILYLHSSVCSPAAQRKLYDEFNFSSVHVAGPLLGLRSADQCILICVYQAFHKSRKLVLFENSATKLPAPYPHFSEKEISFDNSLFVLSARRGITTDVNEQVISNWELRQQFVKIENLSNETGDSYEMLRQWRKSISLWTYGKCYIIRSRFAVVIGKCLGV